MKAGIYKILHKASGRFYIGSASSIKHRTLTHRWHLRRKSHPNKFLQHAWNKYGEDNFEFSTILICSKENLIMYEQKILDLYQTYIRKIGFNIRTHANSNTGLKGNAKHAAALTRMWQRPEFRKKRRVPEAGEKYGRLVLIELREKTAGSYTWLCRCDCGRETLKKVGCLRRGDTRSCGCLNSELASARRKARKFKGARPQ